MTEQQSIRIEDKRKTLTIDDETHYSLRILSAITGEMMMDIMRVAAKEFADKRGIEIPKR